jgi:hypothetical protein
MLKGMTTHKISYHSMEGMRRQKIEGQDMLQCIKRMMMMQSEGS